MLVLHNGIALCVLAQIEGNSQLLAYPSFLAIFPCYPKSNDGSTIIPA